MLYARSSSSHSGSGLPRITLDYNATLFLCMFELPWRRGKETSLRRFVSASPGQVLIKPTGTRPVALHFNGGAQNTKVVRATPEVLPAALLSDLPALALRDASNASCERVVRAVTMLDVHLHEISNSASVLCARKPDG